MGVGVQVDKAVKESWLLSILNLNNDALLSYKYLHSSLLVSLDFNGLFTLLLSPYLSIFHLKNAKILSYCQLLCTWLLRKS